MCNPVLIVGLVGYIWFVRSGQARPECLTCKFRPSPVPLSGIGKKGERERGAACTCGYKGVRADRPESVPGGAWFEVLWNLD